MKAPWALFLGALVSLTAGQALAQVKPPEAAPQDFELLVPVGVEPKPGRGQVLVEGSEGQQVAKVYLDVGRRFIVILPNGRLLSVPKSEATATKRPFQPATKEQIAQQLLRGRFRGFKSKIGDNYVYIYNTSEEYCGANREILDQMLPSLKTYFAEHELSVQEPLVPLVVIMFRSEEEFQKYRKMPEGVAAYYDPVSNYVVMHEQSQLAEAAPMLAVKQCISTVVHEGVHQTLHNIGVQGRMSKWPMWLSEGLAEYCSPTSTEGTVRWQGVGELNHLRLHALLERLKQQDKQRDDGGLVRQIVTADELDSDGYAAAWALTYFLINHRKEQFFDHLREVSREVKPLAARPPANMELFTKHFGDDLAQLQDEMMASVKALPYVDPVVHQPHYLAVLETRTRRAVLVTSSPVTVKKWQQESLEKVEPAERKAAQFTVRVHANKFEAEKAMDALLK